MDLGGMRYPQTPFNNELEKFMSTNFFGPLHTSSKGPQRRPLLSAMLWLVTDTWDFGGEVFNHQQEQCSHWVQTEQLVPSLLDETQLNHQQQRTVTVPR